MRVSTIFGIAFLSIFPSCADANEAHVVFDRSYQWLKAHHMTSGLIVSDSDDKMRVARTKLVVAPKEFSSQGIAYQGQESLQGIPIFAPENKESILVNNEGSLKEVLPGEQLPNAKQFVFAGIDGDIATARFIFLYNNTDVAESLMQMYRMTGDKYYLDEAGSIVESLAKLVDDDGKFYLHFPTTQPTYMGMPQGILINTIHEYIGLAKAEWAEQVLRKMSAAFAHSTEGTWDHWTNSVLGIVIASSTGLLAPPELNNTWKPMLYRFLEQVKIQKGKFPQIIDPANPKWPMFLDTYQSYNLSVLMALAKLDSSVRGEICQQFPLMFNALPKPGNNNQVAGKSVYSARMGMDVCGVPNEPYITKQLDVITEEPSSVDQAVNWILISAYAQPKIVN